MKKTRNQKGITLIALIITIIILLILAVVTIGSIKDGNIIAYAQNAVTDYNREKDKEESTIEGYESLIEAKLPDASKVTYTDEGVPVPSGFKVVTGRRNTGLVIENKTEGSQFVWVPVEEDITTSEAAVVFPDKDVNNLKIINDKLGTTYSNSNDFLLALQTDFNKMKESVNHYNGFYVGRYEVSFNSEGKAQSKGSEVEPYVYSATAAADSANTWYGLYALCKTYNTDSVKSSMIWNTQYNVMMTWMENEVTSFDINKRNTDSSRRTGYVSTDVIRNVYDLGGNIYEWTLGTDGIGQRVSRGRLLL